MSTSERLEPLGKGDYTELDTGTSIERRSTMFKVVHGENAVVLSHDEIEKLAMLAGYEVTDR